jgi:EAL domain-containing protein (putative c-di-GMP-specific phosphodiesterase class I)
VVPATDGRTTLNTEHLAAPVTTDWDEALNRACRGLGIRSVFQPIVDLGSGAIVGYEALTRFDGPVEAAPDVWFREAYARGRGEELESVTLATALSRRADLPPDTFLSINLAPSSLASASVARVLMAEGDLSDVVLELTEHAPVESYQRLGALLDIYRARGARVAIDDAGAGYAGLQHILQLRPSILKLDRAIVSDLDTDETKRSLVEMLGMFAGRIGAQLLAEGVERPGELETLRFLGVPLAQGYLFARPDLPWTQLNDDAVSRLRERPSRRKGSTVRAVLEVVPWIEEHESPRHYEHLGEEGVVVVLDEGRQPIGLMDVSGRGLITSITVSPDMELTEATYRALLRPPADRFQPLLCADARGRYLGVVRMERLITELAKRASG